LFITRFLYLDFLRFFAIILPQFKLATPIYTIFIFLCRAQKMRFRCRTKHQFLNKRCRSRRIIEIRGVAKGVARGSQGCRTGVAFSDKSRTPDSWIILRRRKGPVRPLCDTPGVANLCLIVATFLPHSSLNSCYKIV